MNEHRIIRSSGGKTVKFLALLSIVAMVLLLAQPVLAKEGNPGVAPPGSKPYGKTYADWGSEWWRYVMSFPAATSPLNDATGANCAVGQSGPVFFLVGTAGGSAVRDDCVVPVGKAIFFPVINFMCAVPEDGATVEDLKAMCSGTGADLVDSVLVTLDDPNDDDPFENLLENYRFESVFSMTGAVDNPYDTSCLGRPSGECYEGFHDTTFSDGWWILLYPLPPGEHDIHFNGKVSAWGNFEVDTIYHLTVANRAP